MTRPSDLDAWFTLRLRSGVSIVVAFTERAWIDAFRRFGKWDVVIMWEQLQALAAGVDAVVGEEREARLTEGLMYFAAKQGVVLS